MNGKPPLRVIEGGGVPVERPLPDSVELSLRKTLMFEMLQRASIAIKRGEFYRAEAELNKCLKCVAYTIKREKS